MDAHGWVRVDQILSWRGLAKFQPKVELGEVVRCVREDGKGRFGLWYVGKSGQGGGAGGAEVVEETDAQTKTGREAEAETETQTTLALRTFDTAADLEPANYKIRANQGHSIKGVSEEGLLIPVTLPSGQDQDSTSESTTESAAALPNTVVHGTFYAAYEAILAEGLLKPMSRNHVHFSTGPDVEVARGDNSDNTTTAAVTAAADAAAGAPPDPGAKRGKGSKLAQLMSAAKVRSGMRPDAEVLIYIDIEKALGRGMKWWRSENGVLLSEGLPVLSSSSSHGETGVAVAGDGVGQGSEGTDDPNATEKKDKSKQRQTQQPPTSGISTEFWLEVVEVSEGMGTLWKDGKVVQDLPQRLKGRALPMGKGRRGGGRGGGSGGGRGRGRGDRGREGRGGGRGGKLRVDVERQSGQHAEES